MNNKGFTLIELSIIVMIVGILMIPAFRAYDTYLYGKRVTETKEHIAKLQSEISIFAIKYDRYPCPSDRSLSPSDPMYGYEQCALLATPPTAGTCMGSNDDQALCVYSSDTDTDGTGGPDPIVLGGVPFMTIADTVNTADPTAVSQYRRIASTEILDGWKNQISYAVTLSQTSDTTFDNDRGVILMVDEHGNPIGNDPDQRMHFALISHGKDAMGAFSQAGTRVVSCTSGIYGSPDGPAVGPGTPAAGEAVNRDVENCNPNAIFIMGLDYSDAEGLLHFDDIVSYGTSDTSALWDSTRLPNGDRTPHIRNLNSGNVGFGVSPPITTLDVGGAIKAETKVRSNVICDRDGNNCFNTSILTESAPVPALVQNDTALTVANETAAPGIRCASGRVMVGISQGQERCTEAILPSSWVERRCPDVDGRKTWLRGIRTDGTIDCTN